MKDNIAHSDFFNRKIIIELRFDSKALLADKKGILIESITALNLFSDVSWEMNDNGVLIRDTNEKEESRNNVIITFNRLGFISSKIDSIDSFWNKFEKMYSEVTKILGDLNIQRIGCRIIGTYATESTDFKSVLNNFKKSFPDNFLLKDYIAKDLFFRLNYQNGMYQIGPIDKNDEFIKKEFVFRDCKNHVGVAIDTDNYITNETSKINDKQLIKDLYTLSLSVEKDLYSNLKNF